MTDTVQEILQAEDLSRRFEKIRSHTERLCAPLKTEDYVAQPVMDVSPPKWHLAHTTWFFENFILVPNQKGYKVFDPDFAYLFNSYYVTAGDRWTRAKRGDLTRPTVEEIYAYRNYVNEHVLDFLGKDLSPDLRYVFEIGFQHEQQHQELLLYDIKYILGHNPTFPAYLTRSASANDFIDPRWLEIPEGTHSVGHDGDGFCFDNELGRHKVLLHSYSIRDQLVTNAEFLAFMEDGGYEIPTLWLSEGWDWVKANDIGSPMYWHQMNGGWHQYQLGGLHTIDLNAPVSHVSFYEADALTRWMGKRLPTEFEWEVACRTFEPKIPESANFVQDEKLQPQPAQGPQFFGNLWEWTASAYRPYPYYDPAPGTLGEYNGKFMINTMVLRGGSYATSRDHIRSTYRNFFHPHLQWLFSGIRVASHT